MSFGFFDLLVHVTTRISPAGEAEGVLNAPENIAAS